MLIFQVIVRKTIGKMTNCSFTLTQHILFVVHYVVSRSISISYLPYDHRPDFYRVTHLIIYLKPGTLEVLCTKGNIDGGVKRIDEEPSIVLYRSGIFTKKVQYPRMVRLHNDLSFH